MTCADLEQKLAHATAALQDTEQRHQAALAAAGEQLAERQTQYQIAMARATATWEMVDEQLRVAALEVGRARQDQASAAADVDRLSREALELNSQLAEAAATRRALEGRLAEARTAVDAANARTEHERLAAADQSEERRRQFEALIAQEVERRRSVEDLLAQTVSARDDAERRHASATSDVERLTTSETDLSSRLADVTASRNDLERRLAGTKAAFDDASMRTTRERLAASKRAAEREAGLDGQLRQQRERCTTLEQAVTDADAALRDAEQRHEAALSAAAGDLAERQARFDRELSQTVADRDHVSQRLRDAELALDNVRHDYQTVVADLERLTQREADLTSRLTAVEAARDGLDLQLAEATNAIADADAALRDAEQRHRAALSAAAGDLAERQARFDRQLSQTVADRDHLAQRLRDAELTLDNVRHDHQTAAADVERLTQREADLTSRLAGVQATRDALDLQLAEARNAIADADAALRDAEQRHNAALSAAASDLAKRQARFDRELSQTVADRDHVSQRLSAAEIALANVRHDHQTAAADVERLTQLEADLTSRLADVQAARDAVERQLADTASALKHSSAHETELEGQIQQERATRTTLEQAIADANAALDQIRRDQQSTAADVERLTQREAALTSQLADVQAARDTLDLQLAEATNAIADADAALRDAEQRHEAALSAAASDVAERQARFDRELSQTVADRDQLSQRMSAAEIALDNVRHDHQTAAAHVERLTQREATLAFQLGGVEAARDTLEHRLADAVNAMADMDERAAREHSAAVDCQADLEARLAHETATRTAVEQTLNETRAAALDAERSFEEQASALRARGLEREAQFEVFLAQGQLEHESRLAEMQGCNRTLALECDALQQSLTTVQEQSQQLQETLAATAKALEVATRRTEVLRSEADQLPRLHEQLDEIRVDNNRLFEQAGLAMFRCTPDGALIHANRACTTLVGRRTLDQLPGAQFAPAFFEAPDVLSWLIERCSSTRAKESIETTWQRSDGGRLHVRLSARRLTPHDVIEVTAEDLTRLRVLQARLDQAHRMEAVGRFASEVAVTCGNLLSDIHQNGQQWLTKAGCNVGSRQQGELLIDEVRRAADLLHQLAAFGDEQARTPVLVDLNTLIRDLQPVLKRLAGNHVEIQLRDPSSPLTVDVQTERVERLLVNLASYGRERMPSGGRLRIDLGTIVVNRHFAAKHPHVRLGLHALITVTGIRTAARAEGGQQAHAHVSPRGHGRSARFGVDVGTLHGLVSECGGHLWMTVQPGGDMVAKIRLPLLSPHDQVFTRVAAFRGARERSTTR